MKKLLIPTLVLLLSAFVGCQKETLETSTSVHGLTDPENTLTRSAAVPFNASFETTVTTIGFADGIVTLNIDGKGNGSHIGKSTMNSISSVNTNQDPWLQTGPQVITAANGDELFGDYAGIAIPDQQGNVTFSGTWTITGGTGRFEGVSGSGTYEGSASQVLGTGEIDYNGTLEGL